MRRVQSKTGFSLGALRFTSLISLAAIPTAVELCHAQSSREIRVLSLEERLQEARKHYTAGKPFDALEAMRTLEKEAPLYMPVALEMASVLFKMGKRQEAIDQLEAAARRSQDSKIRQQLRARQAVLAKQFLLNENFEKYQSALDSAADGKRKEAIKSLLEVLIREPANFLILLRLAQWKALEGEPSESTEYLDRAERVLPHQSETKAWRGFVFLSQKRWDEAGQALSSAAPHLSESENVPLWMSRVFLAKGDRKSASEVLEKDLRDHPFHVAGLLELSRLRTDSNQIRQDLQIALSRWPTYLEKIESGGFESADGFRIIETHRLKEEIESALKALDQKAVDQQAVTPERQTPSQ